MYHSYIGNTKGIEVYCWNKENSWYSGLLGGTNRVKQASEIEWLQNNLPCPLTSMKTILEAYSERQRETAGVFIATKGEFGCDYELANEKIDTYRWLYTELGLPCKNAQGQSE